MKKKYKLAFKKALTCYLIIFGIPSLFIKPLAKLRETVILSVSKESQIYK